VKKKYAASAKKREERHCEKKKKKRGSLGILPQRTGPLSFKDTPASVPQEEKKRGGGPATQERKREEKVATSLPERKGARERQ